MPVRSYGFRQALDDHHVLASIGSVGDAYWARFELLRERVAPERLDSTEAHDGRALQGSATEGGSHPLAQLG